MKIQILWIALVILLVFSVMSSVNAQEWIRTPSKTGPFEYAGMLLYDGQSMIALSLPDIKTIKDKMNDAAVELAGSPLRPNEENPLDPSNCPEETESKRKGLMVLKIGLASIGSIAVGMVIGWIAAHSP